MAPRKYDINDEIARFFEDHAPIKRQQCDSFAINLLGKPLTPVPIQGQFSYTLLAGPKSMVIQFRSAKSPLDHEITTLSKNVHGNLVAKTEAHRGMGDNSLFIYVIERLPGVPYITLRFNLERQMNTVLGLARFFAAAWVKPQPQSEILLRNKYDLKLQELSNVMPSYLTSVIASVQSQLDLLFSSNFRWALCHGDLNEMNLLVDEDTGNLTGVVDWAEASIQPFGISLWGLETLLGFSDQNGFHYYSSSMDLENAFWTAFRDEAGGLSEDDKKCIHLSRRVGILLRYGYIWIDGVEMPVTEQTESGSLHRLRAFFQKNVIDPL
ncbi:hypothetical protein FQN57_001993 [Myotisia sp. PD_48]|nr:hypothetical protein FQN57_001993 [Myotisia sp. PD_48]